MNIKNNKNCKITINDEKIKLIKKEKTADELFEELGYKKNKLKEFVIYSKEETRYKKQKKWENCLDFNCLDNCLMIKNKQIFSTKELQAINKKCQELGWIE